MDTATSADVALVFVGTWSLDQTLLWTPGTNATTGEHVDLSDLGLVGAQRQLVQEVVSAMNQEGKKSVVVFVSGKPVAEPWIQAHAGAVVQQFYPGELVRRAYWLVHIWMQNLFCQGGIAITEVLFGDVNPSGQCYLFVMIICVTSLHRQAPCLFPALYRDHTVVLQLPQRRPPD